MEAQFIGLNLLQHSMVIMGGHMNVVLFLPEAKGKGKTRKGKGPETAGEFPG